MSSRWLFASTELKWRLELSCQCRSSRPAASDRLHQTLAGLDCDVVPFSILCWPQPFQQEDQERVGVLPHQLAFAGDRHGPLYALISPAYGLVLGRLSRLVVSRLKLALYPWSFLSQS